MIYEAGWAPEPIWTFFENKKISPHAEIGTHGPLARIQSLFPLSYPGFVLYLTEKRLRSA